MKKSDKKLLSHLPHDNNEISLTTLNHAVSITFNDKSDLSVKEAMELAIESLKKIVKIDSGSNQE